VIQQVEIAVKYAGYIHRQGLDIEKFKRPRRETNSASFDYAAVPEPASEARQK